MWFSIYYENNIIFFSVDPQLPNSNVWRQKCKHVCKSVKPDPTFNRQPVKVNCVRHIYIEIIEINNNTKRI